MMLLKRSKKKKQKKLLEAQQAAAMQGMMYQQQHGGMYPRPSSTLSTPTIMQDGSYDIEQFSGSDDLEMAESLSLTGGGDYTGGGPLGQAQPLPIPITVEQIPSTPQQSIPPQTQQTPTHHVTTNSHLLAQQQILAQSLPPPTGYQPPTQSLLMTPASSGINISSSRGVYPLGDQQHSLKRGMSQPTIANIPAMPPLLMTSSENVLNRDPPVTFITAPMTGSGTLPRSHKKSSYLQQRIDPAKIELMKSAISLGLGRGLDATSKTPWTNKSSFQIRRVHHSIMETNEGGVLSSYQNEVSSIADMDEVFQSSLSPPEAPVEIHVEADTNRCINSSRQTIGRRVLTRTIGFQSDTEEKYSDGDHHRHSKDSHLVPRDAAEVVHNTQNSALSFEDRVYQWLLHRIAHKCTTIGQRLDIRFDDNNYADQLTKLLNSNKSLVRVDNEIKGGSKEIVQALRVTHYVTSIRLGAAEYRIMSDGEYHKQLAQGGAFGLDSLAESAMNGFGKQKPKEMAKLATKMSHVRKIGCIGEDDKVEIGSSNEVVLSIQVQPITRLLRVPAVKAAFHEAIEEYMEGTPASEGGPFLIKCTGRDIYLTVNKFNNYEVEGTEIPAEASLFYFHPTDDGGNPFDFHITYYGEDVGEQNAEKDSTSIGRYLEACPNSKGYCRGPLLMKHSVKVRNTRFTLRSRLSKRYSKSHLTEWIGGEDAFYITCGTRKFKHDSYLAVKNSSQTDLLGKHFFITEALPNIHQHNGDNIFMLFQILGKDSLNGKLVDGGRETPGKLPVASEITTRDKKKLEPELLT